MKRHKLILFDIDGTLISAMKRSGMFGRHEYAINKAFGIRTNVGWININGLTDRRIMVKYGKAMGISRKQILKHLPEIYRYEYEFSVAHSKKYKSKVINGIIPLLNRLKKEGYILGLLTGNYSKVGWLKLRLKNLDGFFSIGAFGEISENRNDLVPLAIRAASKRYRMKFKPKDVYYFGDAPPDIVAGNRWHVNVIAMATGHVSLSTLRRYRPRYLFKDYSDLGKIMKVIES